MIAVSFLLSLAALAGPQAASPALSEQPPARVAVIAVPNLSTDKWQEVKSKESESARARTEELFRERGFELVPDSDVDRCVSDDHWDLNDEEQWTKANIAQVGLQAKAAIVVFVAIRESRTKTVGNFFLKRDAGEVQTESWLLETAHKAPVLEGVDKKAERLAPPPGATGLRLGAVRKAVEATFEPLLKNLPKVAGATQ